MLTLKLISEETERVIRGLEKKNFLNARKAIDEVLDVDKCRREAQQQLDRIKQEAKKMSSQIGLLMKEGKHEQVEGIKKEVAALKQKDKTLQETMESAEQKLTELLCQIPNMPP